MITASQREREHNKPVKLDHAKRESRERACVRPLLPIWIKQEHKWGISINGERIRLACRVATESSGSTCSTGLSSLRPALARPLVRLLYDKLVEPY